MKNDNEIVKGGQGRTEKEIVEGAVLMIGVLVLLILVALVLAVVCP